MTKTTNYNLNQWEADDPVIRTAFNEDNAKLDAALAGLEDARRSDLLGVYSFPAGGAQLDISLSKFDLSKYVSLEVRLSGLEGGSAITLKVRLNGLTNAYTVNSSTNYADSLYSYNLGQYNNNNLYRLNAQILIELDGLALCGNYNTWDLNYYDGVNRVNGGRGVWGIHPSRLPIENLHTINIIPSGALTGGKVLLVGNRF